MSEKNQELELFKLITEEVSEYGWVSDSEFYIWLYHFELSDFVKKIIEIFSKQMFDESGIEANISEKYTVIDLAAMLSGENIELEKIFPKDQYEH